MMINKLVGNELMRCNLAQLCELILSRAGRVFLVLGIKFMLGGLIT